MSVLKYHVKMLNNGWCVFNTEDKTWHGPVDELMNCIQLADKLNAMNERDKVSKQDTIEALLRDMANTAQERREQYGDNWRIVGEALHALYGGAEVTVQGPAAWNRIVAVVQIVNKLCRLAGSQNTHVDSAHDIGPYAAMLTLLVKENEHGR